MLMRSSFNFLEFIIPRALTVASSEGHPTVIARHQLVFDSFRPSAFFGGKRDMHRPWISQLEINPVSSLYDQSCRQKSSPSFPLHSPRSRSLEQVALAPRKCSLPTLLLLFLSYRRRPTSGPHRTLAPQTSLPFSWLALLARVSAARPRAMPFPGREATLRSLEPFPPDPGRASQGLEPPSHPLGLAGSVVPLTGRC